jgi:hypothetical protein
MNSASRPLAACVAATLAAFLFQPLLRAAAAAPAEETPLPTSATLPEWARPGLRPVPAGAPVVRAADLELAQSPEALGALVLRVAGQPMAVGLDRPMIGYLAGGQLRWFDLANAANRQFSARQEQQAIIIQFSGDDPDGGRWEVRERFSTGAAAGAIEVAFELKVNRDRQIVFLPLLAVFPGAGSFGENKGQGLFAGLEYLDNEPSSSEADVAGPAAKRQVPDSLKITFPLMAIQSGERYLALTWEPQPEVSAVFDSPDRLFHSGGHVLGLIFPGADGANRAEGSLLPRAARRLPGGQALLLRAAFLGGVGRSVVPALEHYVAYRGLPPLPKLSSGLEGYVAQAAGGWLDSSIREGNLFRHAVAGGNFPPGQAADAAMWMDWLACQTTEPELASRLMEAARNALAPIAPASYNLAAVGHVRYPAVSLAYGHVAETVASAAQTGRALLARFEPDGGVRYHPQPGGPDYARTHFSDEASGLAARLVVDLLEAAAFSGERDLVDAAISRLRALDRFRNAVPRGAQTWECPLHTPDILASAWLVRAYTLGYELTGEADFREQARYWAWTGVPFVYLMNPCRPVGPYATIPVLGATQWKAPVWIGLPVQWCGLVYADALYRFARHDSKGPWEHLAGGITLSGLQQSWPATDQKLRGLLPDSFVLRSQQRNGPAINPATVQACAARLFGRPAYELFAFRQNGLLVHAPGTIKNPRVTGNRVWCEIEPWVKGPYFVLINGLARKPLLEINGKKADCAPPHEFLEHSGGLILRLEGKTTVQLDL